MSYQILITRQAEKDIDLLTPKLRNKLQDILIHVISVNPYLGKKLHHNLKGNYSYRLSLKDRIIYPVDEGRKAVYIKRAKTHYGD